MISVTNNFDMAKQNLSLTKANETIEKGNRFQKILDNEQGKHIPKGKSTIDKNLMEVCYEFESLLIGQMFKAMKQTIHKKDSMLYGGMAEDVFDDMLASEYAKTTAKTSGFGLAEQIYDQLTQSVKPSDIT